jgi:photosystem II stability/assembly factor-like uncharacterized protein
MESPLDSRNFGAKASRGHRIKDWLPSDKTGFRKLAVFVPSLVALAVITVLAVRQHTPRQFEDRPSLLSWKWWLTPLERNFSMRPAFATRGLASVIFINSSKGWAVGDNGTILSTQDGGKTWSPQSSNTSQNLTSVAFATPQSGWAVGNNGAILHTEDGGKTWSPQSSNSGSLYSVAFVTPQSVWAVGGMGTILHTENGGKTWSLQSSNTRQSLYSVAFATPQSGWAVGNGSTILHTEDGGKTWIPQSSNGSGFLTSVAFATPQSGWVVGAMGTILYTGDGGKNWSPQYSESREDLESVAFATPQSGWALGSRGTILHTEDGGKNWSSQSSKSSEHLYSVSFATPQSVWAAGINGTILHTGDGGETWSPQSSNTSQSLISVSFATSQSGWAVGNGGTILHTEDGGKTWSPQFSNTIEDLGSVTFASPQSGWTVGAMGTILHTEDAGTTWSPQSSHSSPFFLNSVAFATSQSGWAVGNGGIILHTEDGGKTWISQSSNGSKSLISVAFATPQSGWAVGDMGTILHTENSGETWSSQSSNTSAGLYSVASASPQSGWAVGPMGTILHTEDGGRTWRPQSSDSSGFLTSVAFATSHSGWAVGHRGTILHTEDGGKTWNPQSSNTSENLTSVAFATPRSGWAVGVSGPILRTSDFGRNWKLVAVYQRWPAPWFYLATLVCSAGMFWACWPSPPSVRQAIEDFASSDSPITVLKEDALGYRLLVDRLRRFVQNAKTVPPLVLSLQAPWGMGKSSIMRMLESELRDKRAAVTVWFNAWHHQKEDQLLACLLEAVQKQAVPPCFTPIGLSFRFDLLRVRLFSNVDRLVVTGLTLLAAASSPFWFHLLNAPVWLKGVGLTGLTWVILQPLFAFKSDPEKLIDRSGRSVLRTLKDLLTLPSLIGKSDVRQEFAANLKDVVEALEPQRLVIFLDDLDRCRPEQVVQILEAVNFLSSVSKCFVFIGADYQKVEVLAAMEFETIAVQEFENTRALSGCDAEMCTEPDTALLRVEYARNYLRKIVNLRLNLKRLDITDYREFLRRKPQDERSLRRPIQRLMMVVALVALAACYVTLRLYLSTGSPSIQNASSNTSASVPTSAVPAGAASVATTNKASYSATRSELKPSLPQVADWNRDSVGAEQGRWLAIGLGSLITVVSLVYWFSRPKQPEEAEDPTTFSDALQERSEEILAKCNTPREVRRFLNYLRLVATPTDEESDESIQGLRQKYAEFDRRLVRLAAQGPNRADGSEDDDIERFYMTQCQMFGLDPETFSPWNS